MDSLHLVAELMEIAAITAPKTKGENFVETRIIEGEELAQLGKAMLEFGVAHHKSNFDRDGNNVLKSGAVLLIGLKNASAAGLNCGACGYLTCDAFLQHQKADGEFNGPICAYRLLDMGIALGSAAKTASMLNVDNRIMYRIGAAAREMKLVDWEFVMGIPLSVSGKSIYFDRR